MFPKSALLDVVESDLSVFTGCQRGINVTVSDEKKTTKIREGILKQIHKADTVDDSYVYLDDGENEEID